MDALREGGSRICMNSKHRVGILCVEGMKVETWAVEGGGRGVNWKGCVKKQYRNLLLFKPVKTYVKQS